VEIVNLQEVIFCLDDDVMVIGSAEGTIAISPVHGNLKTTDLFRPADGTVFAAPLMNPSAKPIVVRKETVCLSALHQTEQSRLA